MLTRKAIEKKIKINEDKIKALNQQNRNLYLQSLEISDKQQQYSEHEIEIINDDEEKEKVVMGKVSYTEYFLDEDTGKHIPIKRSYFVKRNGIWIV